MRHDVTQAPLVHPAKALGSEAHRAPHAPQWDTAVVVSTSQPLLALPSQSAYPVAQRATVHRPPSQAAVALGGAHAARQAPQWGTLVAVSTSQPLAASPSQSA